MDVDQEEDPVKVYSEAKQYWQSVSADVDGMLGGFSHLSYYDVHDSRKLLLTLFEDVSTN